MDAFIRVAERTALELNCVPEFCISEQFYKENFHQLVVDLNKYTLELDQKPLIENDRAFASRMGSKMRHMVQDFGGRPIEESKTGSQAC